MYRTLGCFFCFQTLVVGVSCVDPLKTKMSVSDSLIGVHATQT